MVIDFLVLFWRKESGVTNKLNRRTLIWIVSKSCDDGGWVEFRCHRIGETEKMFLKLCRFTYILSSVNVILNYTVYWLHKEVSTGSIS